MGCGISCRHEKQAGRELTPVGVILAAIAMLCIPCAAIWALVGVLT